ncbi:hypothetical protein VTN00DRAFT_4973 [Thermoascus crustaceus]|uniref:uncharacterized protein n=1 Tax=Thermoascus crustaceus TaxID=5088 RepID=UPI0037432AC9
MEGREMQSYTGDVNVMGEGKKGRNKKLLGDEIDRPGSTTDAERTGDGSHTRNPWWEEPFPLYLPVWLGLAGVARRSPWKHVGADAAGGNWESGAIGRMQERATIRMDSKKLQQSRSSTLRQDHIRYRSGSRHNGGAWLLGAQKASNNNIPASTGGEQTEKTATEMRRATPSVTGSIACKVSSESLAGLWSGLAGSSGHCRSNRSQAAINNMARVRHHRKPKGAQGKACTLPTGAQVESSEISPCSPGRGRSKTSCPRQGNASIASAARFLCSLDIRSPEHQIRVQGHETRSICSSLQACSTLPKASAGAGPCAAPPPADVLENLLLQALIDGSTAGENRGCRSINETAKLLPFDPSWRFSFDLPISRQVDVNLTRPLCAPLRYAAQPTLVTRFHKSLETADSSTALRACPPSHRLQLRTHTVAWLENPAAFIPMSTREKYPAARDRQRRPSHGGRATSTGISPVDSSDRIRAPPLSLHQSHHALSSTPIVSQLASPR